MGSVPSTPRKSDLLSRDTVESLIGAFVGEKSIPFASEFWPKLLEIPLNLHWSNDRVFQACDALARNNHQTRHLAKLLIHLACCLQNCASVAASSSIAFAKALHAVYLSTVFLKHAIENAKANNFEDLYLILDENEGVPETFSKDWSVERVIMCSALSYICTVDVSPDTYLLHYELLKFVMVAMSTQLLSGPSTGPNDTHPFLNAAMAQEACVVAFVVRRLLLNYTSLPRGALHGTSHVAFSEGSQHGVLQKVGSAAANLVLLPLNVFFGSVYEGSRYLLARISLHVLLILVHFRRYVFVDGHVMAGGDDGAALCPLSKEGMCSSENPYCKALENARDVEFDRVDIEGNAHSGPIVRVPFALLLDTLGVCLAEESSALLLYSLLNGNAGFLEYVLVRTDLDTMLMPIMETLYNTSKRTSNQIYMLLIVLLILSQDSTFNSSIHKLLLPSVPWYQERRLHQISLGSLMVIILTRTLKCNLSRLQDVYLHTNCLATLANMAPHVHRLDAYASERLVSLFHMLSRKYIKLAHIQDNKIQMSQYNSTEEDSVLEDVSMELHIYTDFLRIVLEILNSILTYALPRNPEVVYAIMHRQEVFHPFRSHPRFTELLENIFIVLDFFNSRMDAQEVDGEWSVEKVFRVITNNCRAWRGEGMKMFNQLRFTYEQESHPEEFFIPYVWQLSVSNCGFAFDSTKINLFPVISREANIRHSQSSLGGRTS